jgi:hypothetical protein
MFAIESSFCLGSSEVQTPSLQWQRRRNSWSSDRPGDLLQDIPHPSCRASFSAEVREIVESLQAQLQESEPLVADLQDTKIHQVFDDGSLSWNCTCKCCEWIFGSSTDFDQIRRKKLTVWRRTCVHRKGRERDRDTGWYSFLLSCMPYIVLFPLAMCEIRRIAAHYFSRTCHAKESPWCPELH